MRFLRVTAVCVPAFLVLAQAQCSNNNGPCGTKFCPDLDATAPPDDDAGDPIIPPSEAAADVYKPPVDKCKVPPDDDNGGGLDCTQSSPPNSFTPKTKWTWDAPPPSGGGGYGIEGSIVTPLVGNFTDDDGNGVIDLCDIPDVLITANGGGPGAAGEIYMLNGATGKLEITFEGKVDASVNPAFGDVDNDGLPEIIANDIQGHIVIYDHKGKIQTVGSDIGDYKNYNASYCHALAIYDLDADGTPEIIAAFEVFDNKGKSKFKHTPSSQNYWCPASTAADLDGDGKLEAILGNAAYRSNGTKMWEVSGDPAQPQVANLDSDTYPEIFYARADGILVVEHDGKVKFGPIHAISEPNSPNCWCKPGAVHDFNGDGVADLSASTCLTYGVYKVSSTNVTLYWQATVNDTSGLASTTAFDFLGGGRAQAVYGDQYHLFIFDGKTGAVNLQTDRSSGTLIEYPVVADIDNDQSADIVVVSNKSVGTYIHTVEALQDISKRWIPTRRIWNQHAYHVTNVREDGTIPKVMGKSWLKLNTFRTNAQIDGNGTCVPPPPEKPK